MRCNLDEPTVERLLMLSDMITGRQYANNVAQRAVQSTMYDAYDIFSSLCTGQPFYQNPWNSNKVANHYYTANQAIDLSVEPILTTPPFLQGVNRNGFTTLLSFSSANSLAPHNPEIYAVTTMAPTYFSLMIDPSCPMELNHSAT